MSFLTGLPDFGQPQRFGVVSGYAAYELPGVVAALPTGLSPAPVDGATGPLLVDQYLQERDGAVEEFAVVTAAFVLDVPLDSEVLARPAPLGDGRVRLTAPADLGFPADGLAEQPFDAAAGRVLPTLLRLDGVGGALFVGALDAGLLSLGAVAGVTVRGVAARCPGTVEVDVDKLLAGLGDGPRSVAELEDLAAAGLPGVTVQGGPSDADLVGAAVLDRLVTRLARPGFGADLDAAWTFPETWDGQTTLTWRLDEPVAALRLLRLVCDPVQASGGHHGDVVRRHTARPLTDGHERVVVHTTMPSLPAGVVAATVRLVAPPVPPDRPFPAEATVRLAPPATAEAVLELAPGEALTYDLQADAVVDATGGPVSLTGGPRRVEGDTTPVVTAADLGLRLLPVTATASLLALADVEVTVVATWQGRTLKTRTPIPPDTGRAWVGFPREADQVVLEAVATTRATPPRTVRQPLPAAAAWLDPFSFDDPPWPLPGGPVEVPPVVVEAGGLRLVGRPGDPDWRFVALTAGPARDPQGTPQLSVIEAAGMATFMVTTALLISDDQQATARAACIAAGAPGDVRLSPAPVEVEEVALTVDRGQGPEVLRAGTASGTATQDASFGVTLDAADLALVKRALGGEAGVLAARYVLRVAATGPEADALTGEGATHLVVISDASTWTS